MNGPGKVLVTGASSGIGAALARKLAARGHEVWLAARRLEALEGEVAAIRSAGGQAHAVVLDVSDPERTEARVGELDREVGGFAMVVANAGVGGGSAPVAKQTLGDFRAVLETNLLGAVATLLPVIPRMVEQRRGHLVGVTSLAGEIPLPAAADYGTSKAALSFFLDSAAADLGPRGVAVTDVRPGFVRTPMTDKNAFEMPFLVELEQAAAIIDRGLARRARVVRFPLPIKAAITASKWMPEALRTAIVNAKRPV
jgi:short-subunit dehydrogenase